MGMFEMSADQVAEWRQQCLDLVAVTPDRLYAFKLRAGRDHKLAEEVAVWERAGLKIGVDRSGAMTALAIELPAEGEKATLVGISVKDDPVSQDLIGVLQGSETQPA